MPRRIRALLSILREEVELHAAESERAASHTNLLALNATIEAARSVKRVAASPSWRRR